MKLIYQNILNLDQAFLDLFFRSLKFNLTDRFKTEYPFIYYCNRESKFLYLHY